MMGTMMGSLESWLLLRSLRTLHLRVPRQSSNATILAGWLKQIADTAEGKTFDGVPGGMVEKVWHSSLQAKGSTADVKGARPDFDPKEQMEGGFSPTFGMLVGLILTDDSPCLHRLLMLDRLVDQSRIRSCSALRSEILHRECDDPLFQIEDLTHN